MEYGEPVLAAGDGALSDLATAMEQGQVDGLLMLGVNPVYSAPPALAFEKKLFDKTMRTNAKSEAEIIILDGLVTVYRNSADIWVYIVGTQTENELILVIEPEGIVAFRL